MGAGRRGVHDDPSRTIVGLGPRAESLLEPEQALGMSRAYAYKLIRRLNKEMEERGCITVPGRVSRAYFEKRLFGGEGDSDVGDKG